MSDAIDSGFVVDEDGNKRKIYDDQQGLNILGNLIEGNQHSCNPDYYGSIDRLGRKILGFSTDPLNPYQIAPSALEMFSTSLRDPAFYRLYKRICNYYYR